MHSPSKGTFQGTPEAQVKLGSSVGSTPFILYWIHAHPCRGYTVAEKVLKADT